MFCTVQALFISDSKTFRESLICHFWITDFFLSKLSSSAAEREKNAKLTRDLKEAREETSQIRANTQQIISTYQNSEEVRSNALDGELKSLKEQFESMKTQRDEFDAELTANRQNLDRLTNELSDAQNKVPRLHLCITYNHFSCKSW